jgi:ferrous iron transport protein B
MYDVAQKKGDKIDVDTLSRTIGVPVVKTVASKGTGTEDLLDAVIERISDSSRSGFKVTYGAAEEKMIKEISDLIENSEDLSGTGASRWLALKTLQGEEDTYKKVINSSIGDKVKSIIGDFDKESFEIGSTDHRYDVIGKILKSSISPATKKRTMTEMVDVVLTNKYLGIPIFLAIMWGVFEVTFTFATPFMDIIDLAAGWLSETVSSNLHPDWLGSLIGEGIIGGVGAVLIFVPNIFILFLMLSILESSGYMARAAFIMDGLMHRIGLSGRSFIPMLMGFGCNVPAIMSARTIKDPKDRLITILVNPFISCGARLPVYILFAGIFFGRGASNVIFILYIIGIAAAIGSAKLFRSTILRGQPAPFIMELPSYKTPTLRSSLTYMWDKGYLYIRKAGTVILVGVVVIWFLASFTPTLKMTAEYGSPDSIAGEIGRFIQPIFAPLGFEWEIVVALIFGFVAKEIVVGGLGALYGTGEDEKALTDKIRTESGMTSLNAMGLMVFTLLYMPCIATTAAIKQETGSWKWTFFSLAYGTGLAYVAALLIYQGGRLLGLG